MGKLILVRHGKSLWNVQNIFTGWTDIDLATEGITEAKKAGELLKSNDIRIDPDGMDHFRYRQSNAREH